MNAVAFSADGSELMTAGADLFVKRWDVWDGEPPAPPAADSPADSSAADASDRPRPSLAVDYLHDSLTRSQCVAYSPDGRWIATGDRARRVQVFDAATGELVLEKADLDDEVNAVALDAARDLLIAGGGGPVDAQPGPVWAWRVSTGELLWRSDKPNGPVSDLELTGDGRHVVVGVGSAIAQSGMVAFLRIADGESDGTVGVVRGSVADLSVHPDGTELAYVGVGMSEARIVSTGKNGEEKDDGDEGSDEGEGDGEGGRERLRFGDRPFNAIAYSPSGKTIAVGGNEWSVRLFDRATGRRLWSQRRHNGAVTALAFAGDDRLLSTGVDGSIRIWDTRYGDSVLALEDDGLGKHDLAVSTAAGQIAVAGMQSDVVIRSLGEAAEAAADRWRTLLADDFERDAVGDGWIVDRADPGSEPWVIEDGQLVGTLAIMPQVPSVGVASIRHKVPLPREVRVAYDVTFREPMIAETKLGVDGQNYAASALLIAQPTPAFNFGETGGAIVTHSFGQYREIASRRDMAWDTDRAYRFETTRRGRSLEMTVDGQPFRSGEIAIDAPLPELILQGLFGRVGGRLAIDNLVVATPEGTLPETIAGELVTEAFASNPLRPIVLARLRGGSLDGVDGAIARLRAAGCDRQRLDDFLARAAADSAALADVRRAAIRIAEAWPARDAFARMREAATANTLSREEFGLLLDEIAREDLSREDAAEQRQRTAALVAYRAGDAARAWESLKQPLQSHRRREGYAHPVELALMGLLFADNEPAKARPYRRRVDLVMRSAVWKDDAFARAWADELAAAVEPPAVDTVGQTLLDRVAAARQTLWQTGGAERAESLLADDAVVAVERLGDRVGRFERTAADWIESERLWKGGSIYGNTLVQTAATVDERSADDAAYVVRSEFVEGFSGGFVVVMLVDTFRPIPDRPPTAWPIARRAYRVRQVRVGDLFGNGLDGWTAIDRRLADLRGDRPLAELSEPTLTELAKTLIVANRQIEAVPVTDELVARFPSAGSHVLRAIVAGLVADPDAMRAAAAAAVADDPLASGPSLVRQTAFASRRREEPFVVSLPDGGDDGEPSPRLRFFDAAFQRRLPPVMLGGGETGKYAAQTSGQDLIGLFISTPVTVGADETKTIEQIAAALIAQREEGFKLKTLDSGPIRIGGRDGWQFLQRGYGIGWAVGSIAGSASGPTLQRWALVRDGDAVAVFLVSAFESSFADRDTEFGSLLKTVEFRPAAE